MATRGHNHVENVVGAKAEPSLQITTRDIAAWSGMILYHALLEGDMSVLYWYKRQAIFTFEIETHAGLGALLGPSNQTGDDYAMYQTEE